MAKVEYKLHPSLQEHFMPFPLTQAQFDKICPPEKCRRIAQRIFKNIEEQNHAKNKKSS